MYHSLYYHKDTNEDPKTSSVFETILMLPDKIVWSVIHNACFDNSNLPSSAGQIESYHFWPHWDPTNTTNSNFVEPDVFIRFQDFDLIIEAKYGDISGQYRQQWKNEIVAYRNEYDKGKPVHFIAVGGNADKNNDVIHVDDDIVVNKCSWLSLLIQISRFKEDFIASTVQSTYNPYILRQLSLIELAFNLNGVYNIKWFEDIKESNPIISTQSISELKHFFAHE